MSMKTRRAVFALAALIIAAAVLMGGALCAIDAQSSKSSDSAVLAKLDAVLAAQRSMQEDLASIKEELNIIKIRITQSQ
ncbi:MAG: hypothetical protein V1682_03205 [Candidatus Omnitrophota bacterium]